MSDFVDHAALAACLKEFLPRQRWFGAKGESISRVELTHVEVMRREWPTLIRVEAEVLTEQGHSERYHVFVGVRPSGEPPTFLEDASDSLIGDIQTEHGFGYGYEALRDPELGLFLFNNIFPDLDSPERVRPMTGEMSNTLLVYDDARVFKIFRTLSEKVNLDLEVTEALGRVGFPHVASPLGVWRRDGVDLGMVQPFLAGGSDGWALAQTSLRDLLGGGGDPGLSGGDFAGEALRLGRTTAELHAALAEAFGTQPGEPTAWAQSMKAQLERVRHPDLNREAASQLFQRLAGVSDPGPSIRVHGDLHLGQVMRTDTGWFVLDFGGEPSRPVEERREFSSPLKDVAGMLRSLHYACWTALANQEVKEENLVTLAKDWEERNRGAYVDGYIDTARNLNLALLPSEDELGLVLRAFELDRGIYEIGYEVAHRPDWVYVPLAAMSRLY